MTNYKTMNEALEYIKIKHNGEIPYKYGSNECAKLMTDFAEYYHQKLVKESDSLPSDQRELFDFKNWWNELPDESDDRLFITKGTIERFLKSKSDKYEVIMAGNIMVAQGWKCGKCGLIRAYNRPTCNCH